MLERLRLHLERPEPIIPSKNEDWAAVSIIFRLGVNVEVLFIKRIDQDEDPWSGQVAFPGGRFREEDGNILESAIREVAEEVGLTLDIGSFIGMLEVVSPLNRPKLRVAVYIALLRKEAKLNLGEEVKYAFWAPLNNLHKTDAEITIKGEKPKTVKAYRYSNEVIWGMTARIIEKFLAVLNKI